MASTLKSFGPSPLNPFCLNSTRRPRSRRTIRCSVGGDLAAAPPLDSVKVNGAFTEKSKRAPPVELETGLNLGDEDSDEEKLEPLWDDGYGTETVKHYLDYAKEIIKPDGGPARWFTPISCGPHLKDSPVLLFLPGMDGLGLGLILHHKSLGKVFDVRCMHIPVQDRTPFEGLVKWVEETVRAEHSLSPNRPIYLVGDSFGGCLALAVASRNPHIDLMIILANPATSFGRSLLHPLFPLLEALPDDLHIMVPYFLSLVMGDPVKLANVNINPAQPPAQYFEQLSANLVSLLPRLSGLADIMPKETLIWKMKLLKTAAGYANSRLHAVKAEVLVLASGKDNMLPSKEEASRLSKTLKNCKVRYFKDNGHTILLENGINLLTIIKGTCTYRRSSKHDYVKDFIHVSKSEFKQVVEGNRWFQNYAGPVHLSTLEDGTIVRGLSGVPDEGPVLLVGYHMLMGMELVPLVEEFLKEKSIMLRGMAHPTLFSNVTEGDFQGFSFADTVKLYGGLPVGPNNLFKLLKRKSHVLLYPGGAREALHMKGEEYTLFWPDQPEFVRMAAKFGATIVPFGVVGEDDLTELVMDYNDLLKVPILGDQLRRDNKKYEEFNVRAGKSGEVAKQALYIPALLPKVPGRFYYMFGKPIETKGREETLQDREAAGELYLEIKSEVEGCVEYLLRKRKEDPYRGIVDRTVYQALHKPSDKVPTFEL